MESAGARDKCARLVNSWEASRDSAALLQLRRSMFLCGGLGEEEPTGGGDNSSGSLSSGRPHLSVRARAWKAVLGAGRGDVAQYAELVARGEHGTWGYKIANDAFRTFKADAAFALRVPEARLVRVLNAFAHACEDELRYVQGLNVLAGVLLFVMPELDAFGCLLQLARERVPAYLQPNLDGVHQGCELLRECVRRLDPQLADFMGRLPADEGRPEIWGFAPVLTLCACCPPLSEVLRVWDVLLAAGPHLGVVLYAAHVVSLRDDIMRYRGEGKSAREGLFSVKSCLSGRDFPPIHADRLLAIAVPLLLKLAGDKDFFRRLELHTQVAHASTQVGAE
jgi:cell cycle arrest protein BUB2